MGINDTQNKPYEFSSDEIVEMELVLSKSIGLFYESSNIYEIKYNVQDYFIKYCYERNLPLRETLEELNKLLPAHMRPNMKDIVPSSKRGQDYLIRTTLFTMINQKRALGDSDKVDEVISSFCDLTGVNKETAKPIINTLLKQRRRDIIENDLYGFMEKHLAIIPDAKEKKEQQEMVIQAFSEELGVEPKYIKGVLRDKKKKDEAERKRIEEYRVNQAKSKPTSTDLDDNDGR